jgi:hypothetical protein
VAMTHDGTIVTGHVFVAVEHANQRRPGDN